MSQIEHHYNQDYSQYSDLTENVSAVSIFKNGFRNLKIGLEIKLLVTAGICYFAKKDKRENQSNHPNQKFHSSPLGGVDTDKQA